MSRPPLVSVIVCVRDGEAFPHRLNAAVRFSQLFNSHAVTGLSSTRVAFLDRHAVLSEIGPIRMGLVPVAVGHFADSTIRCDRLGPAASLRLTDPRRGPQSVLFRKVVESRTSRRSLFAPPFDRVALRTDHGHVGAVVSEE